MSLCVCVDCLCVLLRGMLLPWAHTCEGNGPPCPTCEAEARTLVAIETLGLPVGLRAWGPYAEAEEWQLCAVCGSERRGLRYVVTLREAATARRAISAAWR